MWLTVIVAFPDAAHRCNPEGAEPQHIRRSHVVDVGSDPAAVVEFEEVVAGFMVASDEDGEVGCHALAGVVFVEVAHLAILRWHAHTVEVVGIAYRLEVAADYEKIDTGPAFLLACFSHGGVDGVQSSMAAAFDGEADATGFLELRGHVRGMSRFLGFTS